MKTIPLFKIHQILSQIGLTRLSFDDGQSVIKYVGSVWEIENAVERLDSLQIEYTIKKKPIPCIVLKIPDEK